MSSSQNGSDKLDVAVIGATGSVGQRFVQLLENHPWFRVAEVVASERSAGQSYGDACDWRVSAAPPEETARLRVQHFEEPIRSSLVFSAMPGGVAAEVETSLAAEGKRVFTNAKDNRMEADIPLMIPEVNPEHVAAIEVQRRQRGWKDGFIVANANCSTIHLVLALKPLQDAFGLRQVMVTTMQATSGAGYPGVPSLDMVDNVVPFIGGEEEKMEIEANKMLGDFRDGEFQFAPITVSATCTRVPVRDGHTESVSVKLDQSASVDEVAAAFSAFRARPQELELPSAPKHPVVVRTQPDRPQPVLDRNVEHGMASVVGRIRPCPILDVRFLVLGHNTIRGAAGASILNAELLYKDGYLG